MPPRLDKETKGNGGIILKTAFDLSAGLLLIASASFESEHDAIYRSLDTVTTTSAVMVQSHYESATQSAETSMHYSRSPLDIPPGEAKALPSIRVEKEEVNHGIYGGVGDRKHLGGFTMYDSHGVSPSVWKHMLTHYGIKSVVDVGCGKGVSTLWFETHGADVLCVEGSHDAVTKSLLPDPSTQVVEHDYSRGPYWPAETYDATWSVEFLEHVGRNYQYNYIQTFRKSALIFASHSQWGGWHHVEVHDDDWWINKMESFGFRYSKKLTEEIRDIASLEYRNGNVIGPDGQPCNAQHIWLNMQVFINPAVASLPEHAHLFAEPGCYGGRAKKGWIRRKCSTGKGEGSESELPASFYPLELTQEQDEAWSQKVVQSIASS